MSETYRKAGVYVQNCRAGWIEETENGYRFRYNAAYIDRRDAHAVSLTLPLRAEPFDSSILFPFFDGLIPEGWLLDIVSRNWKIHERDRFGLLLSACRDCIGDVRIEPEEDE